jgi:hypothetical protein
MAVRRVQELTEWVESGDYQRICDGDYPRRGQEQEPSEEFQAAVTHYRERFSRVLDRVAGGVQVVGRQVGEWLKRFQDDDGDDESEPS